MHSHMKKNIILYNNDENAILYHECTVKII